MRSTATSGALALTGDKADAHDVCQEAFVAVIAPSGECAGSRRTTLVFRR